MKKSKTKSERRKGRERRKKGSVDLIYQRLVTRNILPERRKKERRKD